ncbi:MAG: cytochrome c peroxidase [Pseudomonadota bacterium]
MGQHLFYDRALSYNQRIACADCHQQRYAFSDPVRFSKGADGDALPRHTLTLVNLRDRRHFGWVDSREQTLSEQMLRPLLNTLPVEMGWKGHEPVILKRIDERYRDARFVLFPEADSLDRAHIISAIVAFERTLVSQNSTFDRWFVADERPDKNVIDGFRLFASDRLGCANCHNGPDLGGHGFRNTGLRGRDHGLATHAVQTEDEHQFLVPSLRNVEVSAPYMHDGRFQTLDDVIAFYAAGNPDHELTAFALTPQESGALIAFLHSLTDHQFLTNPALGPPASP